MTLTERIRLLGLVADRFSEYLKALEHYDAMRVQDGQIVKPRDDEALLEDFAYYIIRDDKEGESF
jgi:hypothetical protein